MQKSFSIKKAFSQGWELIAQHKRYLLTFLGVAILLVLLSCLVRLIVTFLFYKIHGPLTLITQTQIADGRTTIMTTNEDYSFNISLSWYKQFYAFIAGIFKESGKPKGTNFILFFDLVQAMIVSLFYIISTRIIFDLFKTGTTSAKRMLNIKKYVIPTFLAGFILSLGWKFIELGFSYFNPFSVPRTDHNFLTSIYPFIPSILLSLVIVFIWYIFVSIPFSLYDLIIVDDESSAIKSLKTSYTLTKGSRLKLVLFDIISTILLLVTLGLAYPVVLAARVYVYDQLKRNN